MKTSPAVTAENKRFRRRIRRCLQAVGLDLWPTDLEEALASKMADCVREDRSKIARILYDAAHAYGDLTKEQVLRLADVVEEHTIDVFGSVTIAFKDGTNE